ncbi:MAG: gamma-glutamylcyclotransferase [Devosia sp.]|nr:gamma-glutamylcyclotransferase [Devosia sp.]
MTLPPLFFYGTLRDRDILAATLGRSVSLLDLIPAVAPNYAAVYFPDRFYPALVQRIGAVTPGLLMSNARDNDRRALDAFEGEEYHRGRLQVNAATGQIEAEAYFPALTIPATAADWTLEQWTLRHKAVVIEDETAAAVSARKPLSALRTP